MRALANRHLLVATLVASAFTAVCGAWLFLAEGDRSVALRARDARIHRLEERIAALEAESRRAEELAERVTAGARRTSALETLGARGADRLARIERRLARTVFEEQFARRLDEGQRERARLAARLEAVFELLREAGLPPALLPVGRGG